MGDFPKPFGNKKVKKNKKTKLAGLDVAQEALMTQSANKLIEGFNTGPKQFGDAVFKAAITAPPTKMVGQAMQNDMMAGNANLAMSNMPPQPSNVMGVAQPVFDPSSLAAANNIYGNGQMRQNAVNAPNVFNTPVNQNINSIKNKK